MQRPPATGTFPAAVVEVVEVVVEVVVGAELWDL
jgi:hypothetical protein